jgi:hypothetical protein
MGIIIRMIIGSVCNCSESIQLDTIKAGLQCARSAVHANAAACERYSIVEKANTAEKTLYVLRLEIKSYKLERLNFS